MSTPPAPGLSELPEHALASVQALSDAGHPDMALQAAEALAVQYPAAAAVHNMIGTLHWQLGAMAKAEAAYALAHDLAPENLQIRFNRACALRALGRNADAATQYEAVLEKRPDHAPTLNNLGVIRQAQARWTEAAALFRRANAAQPEYIDALANLGSVQLDMGDAEGASASYGRALALDPDHIASLYGMVVLHEDADRFGAALEALARTLAVCPEHPRAAAVQRHLEAVVCHWPQRAPGADEAIAARAPTVEPFGMLWWKDDPEWHRDLAERHAAAMFNAAPPSTRVPAQPATEGPIRIGYVSSDFHDHATMRLAAGLFREHDPARFAVTIYDHAAAPDAGVQARLAQHGAMVRSVGKASDAQVAALARADGLDIAVDLKGYTHQSRVGLFAQRLAPVQISYLGYPGTLGAPFIDYIVADSLVIPQGHERFFSERIIRLPGSYQINDSQRKIAAIAPSRAECNLPKSGFVFCCFNASYKITPAEYAVWMRLLQAVKGSVLWLLGANPWAMNNLRREAEARGVDADRLVFAQRANNAVHLARHCHADLFLDTFACNAHTTASDALWAGLPVLTMAGKSFGARVAASLLNAAGLPELITQSDTAYEAAALELAGEPAKMEALRRRLGASRNTAPLFDTVRTVRAIEAGFTQAHARRCAGLAPADITVPG